MRELTPDERIELRIDVNLKGFGIAEAAQVWGVSEDRIRELCNIRDGETKVDRNTQTKYRQNAACDYYWPQLSEWLKYNDYNLMSLCRIVGLNPSVISNAMADGRMFKGKYEEAVRAIMRHTGVADPRGGTA